MTLGTAAAPCRRAPSDSTQRPCRTQELGHGPEIALETIPSTPRPLSPPPPPRGVVGRATSVTALRRARQQRAPKGASAAHRRGSVTPQTPRALRDAGEGVYAKRTPRVPRWLIGVGAGRFSRAGRSREPTRPTGPDRRRLTFEEGHIGRSRSGSVQIGVRLQRSQRTRFAARRASNPR